MPVYFNRYSAGQRVNIPRHMGRQRTSVENNITIFTDSRPQGGHHHCCCGGGSGFGRFLAGFTAFMGVAGFIGSLFGRGNAQQIQQTYVDPTASFGTGYNQGLYGSFSNPFVSPYTPLTGNASVAQGAYSQGQIVSKSNELTDLICDLKDDYDFSFPEGERPKLSDDGQKYTYDGQEFDTITKLRNYIEDKNSLKAKTPAAPATRTDETV